MEYDLKARIAELEQRLMQLERRRVDRPGVRGLVMPGAAVVETAATFSVDPLTVIVADRLQGDATDWEAWPGFRLSEYAGGETVTERYETWTKKEAVAIYLGSGRILFPGRISRSTYSEYLSTLTGASYAVADDGTLIDADSVEYDGQPVCLFIDEAGWWHFIPPDQREKDDVFPDSFSGTLDGYSVGPLFPGLFGDAVTRPKQGGGHRATLEPGLSIVSILSFADTPEVGFTYRAELEAVGDAVFRRYYLAEDGDSVALGLVLVERINYDPFDDDAPYSVLIREGGIHREGLPATVAEYGAAAIHGVLRLSSTPGRLTIDGSGAVAWYNRLWVGGAPFDNATKIQSVPVSETDPTDGQALVYDGTAEEWKPGKVPFNQLEYTLQTSTDFTIPLTAQYLGVGAASPAPNGGFRHTLFPRGDYNAKWLMQREISTTAPTDGQALVYDSGALAWAPGKLPFNQLEYTIQTATDLGSIPDTPEYLSVTAASPAPNGGFRHTLFARGDYNAKWLRQVEIDTATPTDKQGLYYDNATSKITWGAVNAAEIQGVAVSATAPTAGQALTYNGTDWAPAPAGGAAFYMLLTNNSFDDITPIGGGQSLSAIFVVTCMLDPPSGSDIPVSFMGSIEIDTGTMFAAAAMTGGYLGAGPILPGARRTATLPATGTTQFDTLVAGNPLGVYNVQASITVVTSGGDVTDIFVTLHMYLYGSVVLCGHAIVR
jgi:hypothetical protein